MGIVGLLVIFIAGYLLIAFEHKTGIEKSVPALLTGVSMWVYIVFSDLPMMHSEAPVSAVRHHLGEIAEILFFLIGAMTIVNALEKRGSLGLIGRWIRSENQTKLMWFVTFTTFFLSAILDNLTTTLVILALLRKIIKERGDLLAFAVLVVNAANAGGAWSPIGDVTTTMLWISGKLTTTKLVSITFLPSVVQAIFIPVLFTIFPRLLNSLTKGAVELGKNNVEQIADSDYPGKRRILVIGIMGLLFVPVFKQITHLPPWMGMLFSASVVLVLNEYLNKKNRKEYHIAHNHLIEKVEWRAILFFLGILTAIAAFQSVAVGSQSSLQYVALSLRKIMSEELFGTVLGLLSAVVDNVPLVAAGIDMFDFPTDHWFWHYLAYTAGTGGSILVIGSAAGVVAMGIIKIDFLWYLKRFSFLILLAYLAGCGMFFLQRLF